MNYPYNKRNLLDTPHKYMYTKFEDVALIKSYFITRNDLLFSYGKNFSKTSPSVSSLVKKAFSIIEHNIIGKSTNMVNSFSVQLMGGKGDIDKINSIDDLQLEIMAEKLKYISTLKVVETSTLLHGLVASLLLDNSGSDCKIWLDRLVQRFEVTKKLYEKYQPGFRKGKGGNRSIKLYWLLSLVLCLYYAKTNQIKYLSTLIKVSDLLTSLSLDDLVQDIPEFGLNLVLSSEIIFLRDYLNSLVLFIF